MIKTNKSSSRYQCDKCGYCADDYDEFQDHECTDNYVSQA